MALSFFNLGAWGALYALTPEVYPTSVRASGAGAATAFGRVAAMLAPLLVPVMIQMLVDHPKRSEYDLSSVKNVVYGALPLAEALLDRAMAVFPSVGFMQA